MFQSSTARMAIGEVVGGQIQNVKTFNPGDGVPVGEQQIAIQAILTEAEAAALMRGNSTNSRSNRIPSKYGNAATSGLVETIESGVNQLTIELDSSAS